MRVRLLVLVEVVIVLVAGVGLTIAVSSDDNQASAAPSVSTGTSYCDAARAALAHEIGDASQRRALLDVVAARAPADVRPTVRTVRTLTPGSQRYEAEHNVWDWYNTSHCCDCHFAEPPPEIRSFTPEQRARVEAGGLP